MSDGFTLVDPERDEPVHTKPVWREHSLTARVCSPFEGVLSCEVAASGVCTILLLVSIFVESALALKASPPPPQLLSYRARI